MLRIYICPKCYNFRIVSRKPDAVCFHCGTLLEKSELEYVTYMNMTQEQRDDFRQQYINRLMAYQEQFDSLFAAKASQ